MANTKKQTRAQKIEKNLVILANTRKNLAAFDAIVEALGDNKDAIEKTTKIRMQLKADETYILESTVRQGYMMIVEAEKVEAFVNALPAILK
jgi:hypothetical protein